MCANMDIKEIINMFILNNFLSGDKSRNIDEDDSFLEEGIIDSTGVLELVAFIEETFDIRIEDEELIPENLDSVSRIIAYVQSKLESK